MTSELDIYPHVIRWLQRELTERFRGSEIAVEDTHGTYLSTWIERMGLGAEFPEHTAWDIKVDVTGLVPRRSRTDLVLVECKVVELSLRDIGQILGYCLVANPAYALLVSTRGLNRRLARLLRTLGRVDILRFAKGKSIRLLRWDARRQEPDFASLIPSDGVIFG